MFTRQKFYQVFQIIPFVFTKSEIQNNYGLIFSMLFKNSDYNLVMRNGVKISIPNSSFRTLIDLFNALRQSVYYNIDDNGFMEISFDFKNKFSLNLRKLDQESKNLLHIFHDCLRYGGNIITIEDKETIQNEKVFRVYKKNDKQIIETYNGVKFYLKNFVGGIIESWVMGIHMMNQNENFENKVVVDIGASVGDTPLYYASKGAKVYAFEIDERSYNQMLENIELNPQYSNHIVPINGGIGSDELITYFTVPRNEGSIGAYDIDPSATIFSSHFNDVNAEKHTSQGYTLESAYKKFDISSVDLLKMDCKGCEFNITENDLKNVKSIKIEYNKYKDSHKIENLLELLRNSGFHYRLFKHIPDEIKSFNDSGNIYAYKKTD